MSPFPKVVGHWYTVVTEWFIEFVTLLAVAHGKRTRKADMSYTVEWFLHGIIHRRPVSSSCKSP